MSVPGTLTTAINKICRRLVSDETYRGEETFVFKLDKNASKFTVWYRISPQRREPGILAPFHGLITRRRAARWRFTFGARTPESTMLWAILLCPLVHGASPQGQPPPHRAFARRPPNAAHPANADDMVSDECAFHSSAKFMFEAGRRTPGSMAGASARDIIEPPCVRVRSSPCAAQLRELQAQCPLLATKREPFPLPPSDPRSSLLDALNTHRRLRLIVLGDSIYRQVFWELVHLLRGSRLFIDWGSHRRISYVHHVRGGHIHSAVAAQTSRGGRFATAIEQPWNNQTVQSQATLRLDYIPLVSHDAAQLATFKQLIAEARGTGLRTVLILGSPLMWPLIGNVGRNMNTSALIATITPGRPLQSTVGRFWQQLVQTSRSQADETDDAPFQLVLSTPTERVLTHPDGKSELPWRAAHAAVLSGELASALAALNATNTSDWALVDYAALTRGQCPAASRMLGVAAPGLRYGNWHYMCTASPPDAWNAVLVKVGMRETWECGSTVNTALWLDLLLPSLEAMQAMRSGRKGGSTVWGTCHDEPEVEVASQMRGG